MKRDWEFVIVFVSFFVGLPAIVLITLLISDATTAHHYHQNLQTCVQAGGNWYDGNCILDKSH